MLAARLRPLADAILRPVARALAALGVGPGALTALALIGSLTTAWLIATGRLGAAAVVLLPSASLDALDGAVAKVSGRASALGAFSDALGDRIADAALLGAVAWWFRVEEPRIAALAIATLGLSFLVSYVKARAESLGIACEGGLAERAERLLILAAGIGLGIMEAALWTLAVVAAVTVGQRVVSVWRRAAPAPAGRAGP